MKKFFSTVKAKVLGAIGFSAVASTGANAAILTADQQSQLVTSLSGAYAEYMGLLIAVVTVSAAFYLIAGFAKRLGRGRV